jgi:hypothetical protein
MMITYDFSSASNNRSTIGNANAKVLPVPVFARPTTSRPDTIKSNVLAYDMT